jgi:hypothetical protein
MSDHHHHDEPVREREMITTVPVADGSSAGVMIGVVLAIILVLFVVWMLAFNRGGEDQSLLPDDINVNVTTETGGGGGGETGTTGGG